MNPHEPKIFENITKWIGSPTSFVVHTLWFVGSFTVGFLHLASWTNVLLVLTTVVSLEAIYLSIFIQMSVNRHAKELEEVSEDVEDIQEDIEEISEDMEFVQQDVDEIQEDLEEISEDEEEERRKQHQSVTLETMTKDIQRLLKDLEELKKGQ